MAKQKNIHFIKLWDLDFNFITTNCYLVHVLNRLKLFVIGVFFK